MSASYCFDTEAGMVEASSVEISVAAMPRPHTSRPRTAKLPDCFAKADAALPDPADIRQEASSQCRELSRRCHQKNARPHWLAKCHH